MAKLQALIDALDEGHREFGFALAGLADDKVWVRPHPKLLSIGELAGHIAQWEAVRTTGESPKPDLALLPIKSILLDPRFAYYTSNVEEPVTLNLGAVALGEEVARVHTEAKAALLRLDPDGSDQVPGWGRWTWGYSLQYMAFHIAYHTGQAYSVRHLLGDTPEDN